MTLRISSFALLLSLGMAACGGTIDAPLPVEESPGAADAGSDAAAVDQEPGPDAGAAEVGPHCNPFVPRSATTPGGCCPSGCTPLDPPEGDVYCIHSGTGDAC